MTKESDMLTEAGKIEELAKKAAAIYWSLPEQFDVNETSEEKQRWRDIVKMILEAKP